MTWEQFFINVYSLRNGVWFAMGLVGAILVFAIIKFLKKKMKGGGKMAKKKKQVEEYDNEDEEDDEDDEDEEDEDDEDDEDEEDEEDDEDDEE